MQALSDLLERIPSSKQASSTSLSSPSLPGQNSPRSEILEIFENLDNFDISQISQILASKPKLPLYYRDLLDPCHTEDLASYQVRLRNSVELDRLNEKQGPLISLLKQEFQPIKVKARADTVTSLDPPLIPVKPQIRLKSKSKFCGASEGRDLELWREQLKNLKLKDERAKIFLTLQNLEKTAKRAEQREKREKVYRPRCARPLPIASFAEHERRRLELLVDRQHKILEDRVNAFHRVNVRRAQLSA